MIKISIMAFLSQAVVAVVAPYLQLLLINLGMSHSQSGMILALVEICSIFFTLFICKVFSI